MPQVSSVLDPDFSSERVASGSTGAPISAEVLPSLTSSERQQEKHYNTIAVDYETHYSDASSCEYRRRFIYEPLFAGVDLSGLKVLDAMCGSGQVTDFLLTRGADVTGIDISSEAIESFRSRCPKAEALRRSLLDSQLPDNSFDCVSVIGGLHHLHPHVDEAISEIHRVLKPGGYFCFMEPHAGSLPDEVRKVWYRHDHFFSANEAAVDLDTMRDAFSEQFESRTVQYQGNVAFLLVLNSLIFRIPPAWKPHYSSALMSLESVINKLQGKLLSCYVLAQWQKR